MDDRSSSRPSASLARNAQNVCLAYSVPLVTAGFIAQHWRLAYDETIRDVLHPRSPEFRPRECRICYICEHFGKLQRDKFGIKRRSPSPAPTAHAISRPGSWTERIRSNVSAWWTRVRIDVHYTERHNIRRRYSLTRHQFRQ